MNLVFFMVVALILTCQAEEHNQTKDVNTPESLNVAKNFRKALLEALEQLEKDEGQNSNTTNHFDKDDLDASDYDEDERTKFGHKIRDKISKQEATVTSFSDADRASVFVHSFSTNPQNNKLTKEKKRADESTTEKYRTKQASDNVISASVTSTIAGNTNQLTLNANKKDAINILPTPTPPVTPKTALSSPSPTVSTPVEEDETKAKVEDVQFIHAPLVAAFTVEQDDKGLPHKVIPIFGNKQAVQNANQFLNQNSRPSIQVSLEEKQRQLEQQIRILQEQKRHQEYLLQQQLQRQKQIFEDPQHRFKIQNDINLFSQSLQEQNRFNSPIPQQNSINLQQTLHSQSVQQKNTLKDQTDINLRQSQSQSHILGNQQNNFNFPIPSQTEGSSFSSRPTKDLSGTVVSFQPSISFQPNGFNPVLNQSPQPQQQQFSQLQFSQQQGLPIKAAINFQKAISIPVNQVDNQVTQQQVPNQFRDNVFKINNDNYLQDFFYRQRTLVPPPRGNRIFRQETQVGNFGLNDFSQNNFQQQQRYNQAINYNFNNDNQNFRYNQFNGIPNNFNTNNRHVQNQFFNHHNVQQHSNVDNRIKNLLYQSGLGQGRSQEDLNIVSKVLALDHSGNYQQNFLFGESNVSEKRIPFNNVNRATKT